MNQRAITYRRLQRHSRRLGHRGQRAGDGVRQHGRDVGDRRRLHPQSLDRRERALRRISRQRPGRGRGRRHPHAAEHHRGGAQGRRLRQAVDGGADAGGLQANSPRTTKLLEKHYRDMQDLEFTVERGKLWMLQTRNGKRTAKAALRIAVEMANEGLISTRGRGDAGRARRRSISCCTRPSIPNAKPRRRSRPACRLRPARRAARSCSPPMRPQAAASGRTQSRSWCGSRPSPRTFTACTPPRAS